VRQFTNKAILDNSFCPWCATSTCILAYLLIIIVEQNLVGIDAVIDA